jgi:predicted MPP superfamily phosphohydrolase/small basic protein
VSLFFVIFFTLYGLLHLYAFLKAKGALALTPAQSIPIIIFMAFMTFTPAIVRFLERSGLESFARMMSYIGYIWMGILVLFIPIALCVDIYRSLVYIFGLGLHKNLSALSPSAKFTFFIPLILALTAAGYGYIEAGNIRLEHIKIITPKIPADMSGFKIVQISDVHIGLIVRDQRLKQIIQEVQRAEPDILVSTGDLVDGQINRLEGLADMLQDIKPEFGKFAVTGNHEYYAGITQSLAFTKKAGFTLLRGQAVNVEGIINIAGVDDQTGRQFERFKGKAEQEVLAELDPGKFTILLKHRPLINSSSLELFDLQLSGHTHKGQIFPFNLITKFYYPRHAGYVDLPGASRLYISRGSGTWGPPMRILSPPEITLIELVREE